MLGRFEAFGNPMPASKQIFTKKYFRYFRCTTEIAAFDTDIEWHIGFFEKITKYWESLTSLKSAYLFIKSITDSNGLYTIRVVWFIW